MRTNRRFGWLMVLVVAATVLSASRAGVAAIVNWVPAGGGTWNDVNNWSTTALPTAADAATFTATLPSATNVVTLDANQTVYAVNFAAGTGAKIVNINAGSPAGTLTLLSTDSTSDGSTTFQAISSNTSIGTINAPIKLGDGSTAGGVATFNASQNAGNSLVIAGGVSEHSGQTWGLRITGSGTANAIVSVQTTAMTYSGDTTIANNGVLRLLTAEMIPNGAGKGNVVIEGNGILRGQGNPGGFGNETINGLVSSSATAQVNLNQGNSRTLSIGDGNANGSYAGQIVETTGTFNITKIGNGTQSLAANNSSGTMTVSAGTLLVNGNHTPRVNNANGYSVGASGTLGGLGSINRAATPGTGSVTVTGVLSPGGVTPDPTVGTLTINIPIVLNPASTLAFQLTGASQTVGGGVNDLIDQTAAGMNLTLDGTLNVTEIGAGSFLSAVPGNTWVLMKYTGLLTDNTLSPGTMPALASLDYGYQIAAAGGLVTLSIISTAVPEPAAYLFGGLVCSMMGMAYACRRWRSRALTTARA